MYIPANGEIVSADHACQGEIVVLSDDTLKLYDILGNEELLPRKAWIDNRVPLPIGSGVTVKPIDAQNGFGGTSI